MHFLLDLQIVALQYSSTFRLCTLPENGRNIVYNNKLDLKIYLRKNIRIL